MGDAPHLDGIVSDVVGAAGDGTPEEGVIIGIAAHAGRGAVGEEETLCPEELQERVAVRRRDGVLSRDLRPVEDRCDLVDLPRRGTSVAV